MALHRNSIHEVRSVGAALYALAARLPCKIFADAAARVIGGFAARLRGNQDVLQHAIDVARDGMAIFDRDLRLVAWNRAYAEITGGRPDFLQVGVRLDAVIRSAAARGIYGPVDVDGFTTLRLRLLTETTEDLRLFHVPTGRVLQMRSVRLNNGGLFFTYADATAQVKSEEELEAENVTLERRVRERTEELQSLNIELARAKAEAEDANFSKSRFLAAASHDLLQPLNAARLYTTALREQLRTAGSADFNRLIGNVDLSLEAVEDILGSLLEISQLDAGATQPEITSFAIGNLFTQLAIEFEPQARERGLTFKVMPCSAVILSDRKLLRRLLQNLIANAVKYTRQGRVVVGARQIGDAVRLEVHDTGVGIPDSKRVLIFREFERLPEAARAAPGAGLGLSIVERLSRVLDHDVSLISTVGVGSAFRVTVPRVAGTTASSILPAPRPLAQRSLDGLTVAAIDDEADVLSGMETLLKGWDCVVAAGQDLARIEAALKRDGLDPDVIIADFHVGELDGLDIISALRRRLGPRPAVLITADRAASIRARAQASDVRVLSKPLKPAALRSLLSQWRLVKTVGGAKRAPVENIERPLVET